MKATYIVAAKRSAIGKFDGSLATTTAPDITAQVINSIENKVVHNIEEVILGNVLSAGIGQNPARMTAISAGLDQKIPATTINQVCGSGLRSVAMAHDLIQLGRRDMVLTGGMENMSLAPYILNNHRFGKKFGNDQLVDTLLSEGIWCSLTDQHMGCTAENIAHKYKISRHRQDEYSVNSQNKALTALNSGAFKQEIVPIKIENRGETIAFETDEQPRSNTTLEVLSKLKPAFDKDGSVTAGNASTLNDGAAVLALASEKMVKKQALKPLARIVAYQTVGLDPEIMGMGAYEAAQACLTQNKLKPKDIDLWEINEAFAAQALAVIDKLKIDSEKVNVNGGAIALGHPIGASGARILVSLVHQLKHQKAKRGLATLCIGGGQGIAMIVERS